MEVVIGGKVERIDANITRCLVHNDKGDERWLECRSRSLDGLGMQGYTLHAVQDITAFQERKASRAATISGLEQSRLDAATGALNRRTVLQELNGQISRSRRYGNPLSVALLRFSDCGDLATGRVKNQHSRILVAGCLKEELRWVDSVGAMDDGEFLLLLPETEADAARYVITKLESKLGTITHRNAANPISAHMVLRRLDS